MQNAFVKEGAGHAWMPEAASIVPNINSLAAAVRAGGGVVAWIKNTYTEESRVSWSHFHDELWSPERLQKRIDAMSENTYGHELYEGLDAQPGDETVLKTRYSAFIQGASPLEERLRQRGVDSVIITGTATNVCCEATARDAMMLNFRTVMVSDANAAGNDAEHNASLISVWKNFGDVMTTAETIERLADARGQARAAAE